MGDHIAGGRTILFVPTVPAGVGFDRLVGSMETVAQLDIVVGSDGGIIKDRHGDAAQVLRDLGEETKLHLDAAELEWSQVGKAVYMYAFAQFFTWWGARRAIRKAGAPDWAVKMTGRLTLLIAAPQSQKASGLDKDMIEKVSQKLVLTALPKVLGLAERWDRWRSKS